MVQTSSLEAFGKELINRVRDNVYKKYLLTKSGHFESKSALKALIDIIDKQEALDKIVLHTIDSVLFNLLVMLQDNDATLTGDWGSLNAQDDSDLLCAELWTEDGWIAQFSAYSSSRD